MRFIIKYLTFVFITVFVMWSLEAQEKQEAASRTHVPLAGLSGHAVLHAGLPTQIAPAHKH